MTDDWRLRARCKDLDSENRKVFWAQTHAAETQAAQICIHCEVQPDCLQWALKHEDYGFWAGMNETERRKLRKRLGITLEAREQPLRLVAAHGTEAAHRRHVRAGEKPCRLCEAERLRQPTERVWL